MMLATRTTTPSVVPPSRVMTGVEGFMSRSTPSDGSGVQSGPKFLFLPFGGVRGSADTAADLGGGRVAEPYGQRAAYAARIWPHRDHDQQTAMSARFSPSPAR